MYSVFINVRDEDQEREREGGGGGEDREREIHVHVHLCIIKMATTKHMLNCCCCVGDHYQMHYSL